MHARDHEGATKGSNLLLVRTFSPGFVVFPSEELASVADLSLSMIGTGAMPMCNSKAQQC
jgi:hypothetical protein